MGGQGRWKRTKKRPLDLRLFAPADLERQGPGEKRLGRCGKGTGQEENTTCLSGTFTALSCVRAERHAILPVGNHGGGSRLRGQEYGEFDHVAWVTMKKETPLIAQVMLDGILPANMKIPDSDEKGVPVKKKPIAPGRG